MRRANFLEHPGRLDLGERTAFVLGAVGARLGELLARPPRTRLGVDALASITTPTGALTRHADALAASVLPPWLMLHSSRTWAFGTMLGMRDGLSFDADLLYAASMLHDLGLTERFAAPEGNCFAMAGARAAYDGLREAGVDEPRARMIAEAISLHLELRVAIQHGPEAHLLNRGAALDVVGREARVLERALKDAVVARWPRQGCKAEITRAIKAEARRSPKSRAGILASLGFFGLVARAPFSE